MDHLLERIKFGTAIERAADVPVFVRELMQLHPNDRPMNIWHEAKALIEAGTWQRAGWMLVLECAKQASLQEDRLQCFQTLAALQQPEHVPDQLLALRKLTVDGTRLDHFEDDILPLVTSWIRRVYQELRITRGRQKNRPRKKGQASMTTVASNERTLGDLFDFLRIILVPLIIRGLSLVELIDDTLEICLTTTSETDLSLCLTIFHSIVKSGALPGESLKPFFGVLCTIYRLVRDLQSEAWRVLSRLFVSPDGSAVVQVLLEMISEPETYAPKADAQDEIKRKKSNQVKGALAVLERLLSKAAKEKYPRVPLPPLVTELSNTVKRYPESRMCALVLLVIKSIFGNLHVHSCSSDLCNVALSTASACVHKIQFGSRINADDWTDTPQAAFQNGQIVAQELIQVLEGIPKDPRTSHVSRLAIIEFFVDAYWALSDSAAIAVFEFMTVPRFRSRQPNWDLRVSTILRALSERNLVPSTLFKYTPELFVKVYDVLSLNNSEIIFPDLARTALSDIIEVARQEDTWQSGLPGYKDADIFRQLLGNVDNEARKSDTWQITLLWAAAKKFAATGRLCVETNLDSHVASGKDWSQLLGALDFLEEKGLAFGTDEGLAHGHESDAWLTLLWWADQNGWQDLVNVLLQRIQSHLGVPLESYHITLNTYLGEKHRVILASEVRAAVSRKAEARSKSRHNQDLESDVFGIRSQTPNIQHDDDTLSSDYDQSDIESILSVGSLLSSRSSQSSNIQFLGAVVELVNLLLDDAELGQLYPVAISKVGAEGFQRNFARFLMRLGQSLKDEASTELEHQTAYFVRAYARQTAAEIKTTLHVDEEKVDAVRELQPDATKTSQLNAWLEAQERRGLDRNLTNAGNDATQENLPDRVESDDDLALDDIDADADSDDPDTYQVPTTLGNVKLFITSARAFQTLRSDFRVWLKIDKQKDEDDQGNNEAIEDGVTSEDVSVANNNGLATVGPSEPLPSEDDRVSVTTDLDSIQQKAKEDEHEEVHNVEDDMDQGVTPDDSGSGDVTAPIPLNLPLLVEVLLELLPFRHVPPVASGKVRATWKCQCGKLLYDDYTETEAGSIDRLMKELAETHSSTKETRDANGNAARRPTHRRTNALTTISQGISSIFSSASTSNQASAGIGANQLSPASTLRSQATTVNSGSQDISRLLLCIDNGFAATPLFQERLGFVSTDRQLFSFLRSEFFRHWNVKPWLTLRSLDGVCLTRFTVDLSNFTEVHKHGDICQGVSCICLPPKDRIDVEYKCHPEPGESLGYAPAIGPSRLKHYFLHPECIRPAQKSILAQLPKRVCGALAASDDQEAIGWGLHFKEGWHWDTIYCLVAIIAVSGLVFGITWSVVKGDIQSGFAISSYWITVGSLLLGALALGSKQRIGSG